MYSDATKKCPNSRLSVVTLLSNFRKRESCQKKISKRPFRGPPGPRTTGEKGCVCVHEREREEKGDNTAHVILCGSLAAGTHNRSFFAFQLENFIALEEKVRKEKGFRGRKTFAYVLCFLFRRAARFLSPFATLAF